MKRLVGYGRGYGLGAAILLTVFLSPDAFAICQKCNDDITPTAQCYTLTMCETGATMSACVVVDVLDPYGQVAGKSCDDMDTTQGPECNGADPSCSPSGGTGGGGGGGQCTSTGVGGWDCPAECGTCTMDNDGPPPCWPWC
jgi:hypothetical protein